MKFNFYTFSRVLTLSFIALALLSVGSLQVEAQNALDFDGTNDYASIPGASSKISSTTPMSLSVWVYPTNANSGWPNFDGIAGFRNNSTADFYMLQLSSTNVEIRFRNSSGTNYDITYTGLTLNTWHHFVITYDGSKLRFYDNGLAKDSISATGSITTTTEQLYIGKLLFGANNFCLDGKVDEVSLWNKALSLTEINNIYTCGPDATDPNLQLHYNFDHGTAGGTNTGITTLTDQQGSINGALYNFALSGNSSNWVTGLTSVGAHLQTADICDGDSILFGNQYIKTAGTHTHTFPTTGPCDSTVMLTLTVHAASHYIQNEDICQGQSFTWHGNTYTTSGQYFANYTSVYGCDSIYELNLTVHQGPGPFMISGADSAAMGQVEWYTVPADPNLTYVWSVTNGQIQTQPTNDSAQIQWFNNGQGVITVDVTDQYGCEGDSSVKTVWIGNIGIDDISNRNSVVLYPNPAENVLEVISVPFENLTIYDMEGKVLLVTNENRVDISSLAPGIYFVKVYFSGAKTNTILKFVKK